MKRSIFSKLLLLTTALTAAVAVCSSQADTPALSFTGGGPYQGNGDGNVGWSFTLNTAMNVSSLGFYDYGSDGLQTAHAVGIFSSTGTLLTSATVPLGTNAALTNGFRYVSIPVYTLSPGTYIVDAAVTANNSDYFMGGATTVTTVPGITYLETRVGGGTGLVLPPSNSSAPANGFFGPNFQVSPAPEPSTWALMGLGAGMLVLCVVRRRNVPTC